MNTVFRILILALLLGVPLVSHVQAQQCGSAFTLPQMTIEVTCGERIQVVITTDYPVDVVVNTPQEPQVAQPTSTLLPPPVRQPTSTMIPPRQFQ